METASSSPAIVAVTQAENKKERIDETAEGSSAGDEFKDVGDGGKCSDDIIESGGHGMEIGDGDPVIRQEDQREHQSIPVRRLVENVIFSCH